MASIFLADVSIKSSNRLLEVKANLDHETHNIISEFQHNQRIESTIVFAFFEMPNSKHSSEEYINWMDCALCIDDAIVIFTSPGMVDHVKARRSHAVDRTLIIPLELEDIEIGNRIHYDDKFWEDQNVGTHKNGNLFKIWLAKSWFVNQAIELNPFNSNIYTWMDIGHFREGPHFCGKTVIRHPEVVKKNRVMLFPWRTLLPSDAEFDTGEKLFFRGFTSSFVAGGCISGDIEAWPRYLETFEETVELYVSNRLSLSDDQPVIQSNCMRHKDLCVIVRWDAPYGTETGNCWNFNSCVTDSGWKNGSAVNTFFAMKFRFWHGGDTNSMYWDPGYGIPTQEEDPSLYSPNY